MRSRSSSTRGSGSGAERGRHPGAARRPRPGRRLQGQRGARGQADRRRHLPAPPRRGAGPGRRIRMWQDDHRALAARPAAPEPVPRRGHDRHQLHPRRDARPSPHRARPPGHALEHGVDRLPGRDERARPRRPGLRPDRRGDRAARPGDDQGGRQGPHRRAVRVRRHQPEPGEAVPARVLGRHAPARDDRPGAGLQPGADHRRRADHGARRDDAGADPGAAREPAPRLRPLDDPDHPRPVGAGRDVRPGGDHVRRPDRRVGPGGAALRQPAASVHAAAAGRVPDDRRPARAGAGDPRRAARPGRRAGRMPLLAALPPGAGPVPGRDRGGTAARRATAPCAVCSRPGRTTAEAP